MKTPAERCAEIIAEVRGCYAQYGIGSWEREFLASPSVTNSFVLSAKQEEMLSRIEQRVFGDGDPGDYPDPDEELDSDDA